jgi:hypothetical protein
VTSFLTLVHNTSYNNLPTWKENISMPWCVRTLKIVGPEEVEVSDLCGIRSI